MKIIITIEERDRILELLTEKDFDLKNKLLKNKRGRKGTTYKKCTVEERKLRKKIEEIIRANYKIKNEELIEKLDISKALFYRKYNQQAKKLRENFRMEALL